MKIILIKLQLIKSCYIQSVRCVKYFLNHFRYYDNRKQIVLFSIFIHASRAMPLEKLVFFTAI